MPIQAICWNENYVTMIDQTQLPENLVYLKIDDYERLGLAIRRLEIRGAPAIGIAAAYGVLLGIKSFDNTSSKIVFFDQLERVIQYLKSTRPTAVNLAWSLDRIRGVAQKCQDASIESIKQKLLNEALAIHESDRLTCALIGKYGAELLKDGMRVLTHCNAGALATGGIGTALGIIYTAVAAGKKIAVYADETRPLLQGSRITAWELQEAGIDVTLICDNMAAYLMQQGKVDIIIVGADRIARNGDTANKIGTYSLAVLAEKHQIPFYIAAPLSTFDFSIADGTEIPVEERAAAEITNGFGKLTAPVDIKVYNPAFDVTPFDLIKGFITEKGVIQPPFAENF
ncbi:S-methyl-5-thioribose-1-phosphate isomerase [candidate division KSB1 bacterium]|nr:S-methyl-5-thioribose-1-phosphate isomerase [candidate division KSB1 bacterium]